MDKLATVKKPPSKDRNWFARWGLGLVQVLFTILLIAYLVLILLETFFKDSVSSYLNLDHLLIAVIAVGIVAILTAPPKVEGAKEERLTKRIYVIICAGIGGAAIIWYKTQEIGSLSYVLSAMVFGLMVLLAMPIWRGNGEAKDKGQNRRGS